MISDDTENYDYGNTYPASDGFSGAPPQEPSALGSIGGGAGTGASMGGPYGAIIGAALGLLSANAKQNAYQAQMGQYQTQLRNSPWTHMVGSQPTPENGLGQVLGYSAAGGTLGQGNYGMLANGQVANPNKNQAGQNPFSMQ